MKIFRFIIIILITLFLNTIIYSNSTTIPYTEFTPMEEEKEVPFTISKYWVFGTGFLSIGCLGAGVWQMINVTSKKNSADDAFKKYKELTIDSESSDFDKYYKQANDNLEDARKSRIIGYTLLGTGTVLAGVTVFLMFYVETDVDLQLEATPDRNSLSMSMRF